jgi:transcriptional regulator with XRE-family HTH domain
MANQRESTNAGDAWEGIFATRMRELRERATMSQASLAEELWNLYALKLDASAIARIEKNAHGPDGARLIRLGEAVAIANCLNSSMEEMLRPELPIKDRLTVARARMRAMEENVSSAQANVYHQISELRQQQELVNSLEQRLRQQDERRALQAERETVRVLHVQALERMTGSKEEYTVHLQRYLAEMQPGEWGDNAEGERLKSLIAERTSEVRTLQAQLQVIDDKLASYG